MPPKYIDQANARIAGNLKRLQKIVAQAKTRSVNEADTRDIVKAMIGELLGFDMFFEVTGEFSVKGQYADFAVKSEETVLFFVEVKSIGTNLDAKHLFQVVGYAANHGVEWAVLTNADRWVVYRLFAGSERQTEPVLDVTLSETSTAELCEAFLAFSKEGFRQSLLQERYQSVQALHPRRIADIIVSEAIVPLIRRELKRTTGFGVSDEAVRDVLLNQVVRGDIADEIKGR